jgi:uncharacterized repeat protein (TIGR03837 family)
VQAPPPPRWDLFCRVIDNFGDVGVCWRLARDLVARGNAVRLVIDDDSALAWMAPVGAAGVQVLRWPGPADVADVVIEAFGCDPPPGYVAHMAATRPVWINLEYLSAEPYVERSHTLPSPQRDGQRKWFFYPGFTGRTGGLLREPGLIERRAAFEGEPWLATAGFARRAGERVVSLFCYDNPAIETLLDDLAREPTLLLLARGAAQRPVPAARGALRLGVLPYLSQPDFDHLLWSCDLNFVRGEDSLVRAIWAGAPFVWQAYPQHDGAHHAKLEAMLASAGLPPVAAAAWRAWNGAPGATWPSISALADPAPWQAWRARLLAQTDLTTQLLHFAAQQRDSAASDKP